MDAKTTIGIPSSVTTQRHERINNHLADNPRVPTISAQSTSHTRQYLRPNNNNVAPRGLRHFSPYIQQAQQLLLRRPSVPKERPDKFKPYRAKSAIRNNVTKKWGNEDIPNFRIRQPVPEPITWQRQLATIRHSIQSIHSNRGSQEDNQQTSFLSKEKPKHSRKQVKDPIPAPSIPILEQTFGVRHPPRNFKATLDGKTLSSPKGNIGHTSAGMITYEIDLNDDQPNPMEDHDEPILTKRTRHGAAEIENEIDCSLYEYLNDSGSRQIPTVVRSEKLEPPSGPRPQISFGSVRMRYNAPEGKATFSRGTVTTNHTEGTGRRVHTDTLHCCDFNFSVDEILNHSPKLENVKGVQGILGNQHSQLVVEAPALKPPQKDTIIVAPGLEQQNIVTSMSFNEKIDPEPPVPHQENEGKKPPEGYRTTFVRRAPSNAAKDRKA